MPKYGMKSHNKKYSGIKGNRYYCPICKKEHNYSSKLGIEHAKKLGI